MPVISKEIISDPSLSEYDFKKIPLLEKLRKGLMNARTEICIERAVLFTEYVKQNESQLSQTQRAGAVHHYLSKRKALFLDDSLLGGNSTSKLFGAPVYPEYFALSIWPELETISTRKANKQYLSAKDADTLNFDVYPYWVDRSITELTRTELNPPAMALLEKVVYFLAGKASVISHTTPCYEKMLSSGLKGIINEAQTMIEKILKEPESPDKQTQIKFYESVQTALRGIIEYAQNLSAAAAQEAKKTSDPTRKNNFLIIADVCSKVPENPPQTFREAANAMLLCHIGVLSENVNMALNP
ncbi:MAG TPA: pyruvate formate lyase family protein, partial [Spirochaetota bacterium]|nr:pyruvate formate lyase family protein [Spirochaetota bacterium]